jgi:uncharacterized DUF497 family protein
VVYEELDYDEERLDHIAEHGVDIEEVSEVWVGEHWMSGWENDKRRVYGQTESGRYLMLVVGRRARSRKAWLVTVREMTEREKKNFRRRMRK